MGLFFDYFNSGLRWTLIDKMGPVRVLVQGAASALDEARNALVWLRNQFNPGTTTDTASIEAFAASRGIVRLPEEPYDYYLARLINAFMWYRQGGTEPSLAEVLRLCGYDTIKVTNCRDIDPERWAEFLVDIIPDPDDVLTSEAALLDMISIVKPARSKCAGVRFAVPPSPALIHMGSISMAGLVVTIPPYIPASPVLLLATISSDGKRLTLVFDRPMARGLAYQDSDFNLDVAFGGTDIGLTYVSGSWTDTWVFSVATVIRLGETVDLDFIGRTDGIEDADGNDLEMVGSFSVFNGSEETFSDIIFWDGFEGSISGSTYTSTENDYPANHTGVTGVYCSLNTATNRVGSKAIYANNNSNVSGNEIIFTIDPIPASRGRIGFWTKPINKYSAFFILYNSLVDVNTTSLKLNLAYTQYTLLFMLMTAGANDPLFGSLAPIINPVNRWSFFEVAWDHDGFGISILQDGAAIVSSYSPKKPWPAEYDQLSIGGHSTYGSQAYFDNVMISTDPNRDLYALALLEVCPRVS